MGVMDLRRPWSSPLGTVRGQPGRRLSAPPPPPPPIPDDELVYRGPRLRQYRNLVAAGDLLVEAYRRATGNHRGRITKYPKDMELLALHLVRVEEVDPVHFVSWVCVTHTAKYGIRPFPGQVLSPTAVATWLPEYRRRQAHYFQHTPRSRG